MSVNEKYILISENEIGLVCQAIEGLQMQNTLLNSLSKYNDSDANKILFRKKLDEAINKTNLVPNLFGVKWLIEYKDIFEINCIQNIQIEHLKQWCFEFRKN